MVRDRVIVTGGAERYPRHCVYLTGRLFNSNNIFGINSLGGGMHWVSFYIVHYMTSKQNARCMYAWRFSFCFMYVWTQCMWKNQPIWDLVKLVNKDYQNTKLSKTITTPLLLRFVLFLFVCCADLYVDWFVLLLVACLLSVCHCLFPHYARQYL